MNMSNEAIRIPEEYAWQGSFRTECDRCHDETVCDYIDFGDGSGEWDYCRKCWAVVVQRHLAKGGEQ